MMQERDRLQKLAVETINQDDWRNYKNLRNRINNRLKIGRGLKSKTVDKILRNFGRASKTS